jgi:DNA-binding TFAR19-related protein (PDSD5 family)
MASSGMLRRVALVRTDVSEYLSAFIIMVTRTGELGTTLVSSGLLRRVALVRTDVSEEPGAWR